MTTTSLFVELIVIGVMAAAWLTPVFAMVTEQNISGILDILVEKTALWVPGLVFCYVLGVVLDVLIDRLLFHRFEYAIRADQISRIMGAGKFGQEGSKVFQKRVRGKWHVIRTCLWQIPTDITACEISTYFRHRIRIVRAASVNSFLLGIASFAYCAAHDLRPRIAFACFSLGAILAVACAYSWQELTRSYNASLIRYYRGTLDKPISTDELLHDDQVNICATGSGGTGHAD